MMPLDEKISYLEQCLNDGGPSYADSFKADIALALGDFEAGNPNLRFLDRLTTEREISDWVNALTSRIVLKHDEEDEPMSEFVREYVGGGWVDESQKLF
jgi:hypothetical protein